MIHSNALKQARIEKEAIEDFSFFIREIFSKSFKNWIDGSFLDKVASIYQDNKKTMRVSARYHFKSTSLYAHFMWEALKANHGNYDLDCHYFSYMKELAGHHISGHENSIKRLVERNPYFEGLKDLKPQAETIGMWSWDEGKHIINLRPQGMLAFKRGIHGPLFYVDDPFQDPESKLTPTVIYKINRIFVTQVMNMPVKDGQLHVVGTPQTNDDFFFDSNVTRRFKVFIQPAIINEERKEVLWPEYMDYEELCAKRKEMTPKYFNPEYQCSPIYVESAFFNKFTIERISTAQPFHLKDEYVDLRKRPVVGGLDIGKKTHPSHVVIFRIEGGVWRMIYQEFWDYMDYGEQVEKCGDLIVKFDMEWLGYDNTRGEFEAFKEKKELPAGMEEVILSLKIKSGLATEFDKKVAKGDMILINDQRLQSSLLSVNNDLKALVTPAGHGDAFFSILCALQWEVGGASGHFKDIKSSEKKTARDRKPFTAGLRSQEF